MAAFLFLLIVCLTRAFSREKNERGFNEEQYHPRATSYEHTSYPNRCDA